MTHLIRALLWHVNKRMYNRFNANRYVTGKDMRPVTYRPGRKK
jgi:hypothetical protein